MSVSTSSKLARRVDGERVHPSPGTIAVLLLAALYFLLPLWWLIVSATKSNSSLFNSNGFWFHLPQLWENLTKTFTHEGGGQTAYFAARFTGVDRPNVHWQRNDGDGWTDVAGTQGNKLSVGPVTAADSGAEFRAIVEGPTGPVTTEAATLTVLDAIAAPAVTQDPADRTATAGEDVVFTSAAAGTPVPDVQWQSSLDGAAWEDIDGATGPELSLTGVGTDQDGLQVRAVFTSPLGATTSAAATLVVTDTDGDDDSGTDTDGDDTGESDTGGESTDDSDAAGSADAGAADSGAADSDAGEEDSAAAATDPGDGASGEEPEELPSTGATIGWGLLGFAAVFVTAGAVVLTRRGVASR